jgi:hypothetical protein
MRARFDGANKTTCSAVIREVLGWEAGQDRPPRVVTSAAGCLDTVKLNGQAQKSFETGVRSSSDWQDKDGCSPAKIRVVHKKMRFRPGSLKYVRDNLTVTGAARMPMEHSWKAPNTSMSTAPGDVASASGLPTRCEMTTFAVECRENDTVYGSNGRKQQRRCKARISEPLLFSSKHAGGYEDVIPVNFGC